MYQAAGVVLLHKDGSVYLNLRDNNTDYFPLHWSIIGGRADEGETPEQTARRELKEETGYEAEKLYFLSKRKRQHPKAGPFMAHGYWCVYDGKQALECHEGLESKFIPIRNLDSIKIIPFSKEFTKKAWVAYEKSRESI